ncbi:peptidylprolyl isomerase [Carnobacterium sp. TMP28]|uniref:peptidylprolyl isomerase n=1 Tax=Carnobacterium sp. TMP28 TaxID=3397060 RepID=UPI0039DF7034
MCNVKFNKLIIGGLLLIVAVAMIIYGLFYIIPNKPNTDNQKESDVIEADYFPQLSNNLGENEIGAEIVTSMGTISIKLFPEFAPKAVENFVGLSEKNYYDKTIFHRVIQDFMIQGGDPDGTGLGGESLWGEPFEVETSDHLYHTRGALSMAKTNAPISIGSQFFIVQNQQDMSHSVSETTPNEIVKTYKNGGYPSLDGSYTVFGQVIEGMDIVDSIAASETTDNDLPLTPITIETVTISK